MWVHRKLAGRLGRASPLHLRATAELAERVLLPGDPGRALLLAQELLEAPRMFNHHRGLWGYTGEAVSGGLLTIQSTGMGGPSAAIVIEELIGLGARELVRAGTCGALSPEWELGAVLTVGEALAEDGASLGLGARGWVAAVPEREGARVASTDLFYARDDKEEAAARARWAAAGAVAVEMECATLFTLARLRGVRAAAVLTVSDVLDGPVDRQRISDEALEEAARRLGHAALALL